MAPATNAQKLILQIFDAWRAESFPSLDAGTAFEIFASELVLRDYGLSLEDVQSGVVGGGQDGAIDSVYTFFDDTLVRDDSEIVTSGTKPSSFGQGRTLELWVIQTKRSAKFEETALDKLENSLRRFLDLTIELDELSGLYNEEVIAKFGLFRTSWRKLLTRRPKIRVNVAYATPGNAQGINPQVEVKVNALRSFIESAVPDNSGTSVELVGAAELVALYNERPTYSLPMQYQEAATSGNSHVALVKLSDYYDLIVDERGRLRRHLFDDNVRDYEGNVSVNQDIRKSLTSESGPEFWWLNNGVTILCSSATSAGKIYSLENIQVVNGLQTSHEIYRVLADATAISRDRMLLVRIIVTDDIATRDQVIKATNRQTAVSDSSLRATDEIQRNIENYFLANGWFYDRRKNFYKNDGKDPSRIISISMLGAAITAMGLARPDKSRGKPSSLLKNNEDYKSVFNDRIPLEIYYWAARLQRKVDTFILSLGAEATVSQKSNLKFHLSMLAVERLNGGSVRSPQLLRQLAVEDVDTKEDDLRELFNSLKAWSDTYLQAEGVILERATKAQRFTEYLLNCAASARVNSNSARAVPE